MSRAAILSPIDIGPFELKNRIISTGHTTAYNPDGLIGDQEVAYHARKAQGGVALSVTGSTTVHPSGGAPQMHLLANFDDSVLPGYRKLAEAVHAHGGRMLIQLTHLASGFASHHTGHATWAPSQVMGEFARELPHVMTGAEIETLLDAFAKAARRIRLGGLDGIELQAFAASLAIQFLSPYTNKRTDQWGGSLENRARFPRQVVRAVRDAIGGQVALTAKVNMADGVPGGSTPRCRRCRAIDAERMIDFYVIASGNNMEKFARVDHWPPTPAPQALHAPGGRHHRSPRARWRPSRGS
jgi:2,4-dienoyl-CoA reductase (NADPH2)